MSKIQLLSRTLDPMSLLADVMGSSPEHPLGTKDVREAIRAGNLWLLEHCHATFKITSPMPVLLQLEHYNNFTITVNKAEHTAVVTGSFRAWYEYFSKNVGARVHPESRQVTMEIQKRLAKSCPDIFDRDFVKAREGTE